MKHLGLLKPWAPTMSAGLCVKLDRAFQPRFSLQSRADGRTHGVTAVAEHRGQVFVAARGDGVVVSLPPGGPGRRGMTPIVEVRNATKEYRGVPAVKDVSFTLHRGEVHALLGENGAGKSTLTKMIAGVVQPTAGEIWIDGAKTELGSPSEALKRGIAMVYQETSLVPSLTVAQNIYLTDEKRVPPAARHLHRRASSSCSRSTSTSTRPRWCPASAPARSRWWRSRGRCITTPR